MSRLVTFSASLVFALANPVLADSESAPSTEDNEYARDGIYAGINAGGAFYTSVNEEVKDALEALGYNFTRQVEKPPGLGAHLGYRFHPRLAGELQFQWFAQANVEFDNGDSTFDSVDIDVLTFTANVKAFLCTGRIQPFLLLGAGVMNYDIDDKFEIGVDADGNDFVARFGGGLSFYFNPNWVVSVDSSYMLPASGGSELDHIWVSGALTYRF